MAQTSPYYKLENSNRFIRSGEGLTGFIKRLLTQQGKVFEVNQEQGKLVPYHCHSHQEIIVLVEGSARFIVEEDIIDLEAGDVLFIEPWAIHLACFPKSAGRFFLCFPNDQQRFSLDEKSF